MFGLCSVTWLLLSEYLFFKKQSDRFLELQEDYRTYILAVNKILQDYNKTKEELDILKSVEVMGVSREKKKEIDVVGLGFYFFEFEAGACIYSSDDIPADDSLLLVNRDLDYLRDVALQYLKHLGDQSLLSRVNFDDWCHYTDYALADKHVVVLPAKKKKDKPRRNKKVASYRGLSRVAPKRKNGDVSFSWPIERSNFWLSSLFGSRKKPNGTWGFHYGLDMAALRGTHVCAVGDGLVTEARFSQGYGNTVVITHSRKYRTRYAHLDKIVVKIGQKVKNRELIGVVGSTGLVWKSRGRDPSHLHFEVHSFGKQVNPLSFLV